MPSRGRGEYQKSGQSQLRRRWNIMRAVRRFRGEPLGMSWTQYVRATHNGSKKLK